MRMAEAPACGCESGRARGSFRGWCAATANHETNPKPLHIAHMAPHVAICSGCCAMRASYCSTRRIILLERTPMSKHTQHVPPNCGVDSANGRSKRRASARAHRPSSPLNNAAIKHPKWKRPNAQKHGVYARALVIPGEDSREYEQLHSELIDEWKP
jgi:hypothetical protein